MERREFIEHSMVGISAGFALSVLPTAVWAITTPGDDLVTGTLSIPVDGGKTIPGYHAMPKGAGPFPVVLVVQEIFGIHEYIQDVCRRLAKQGYLAIAPSLYSREGDVTQLKDMKDVMAVVAKVPQQQVWSDLDATVKWAADSKKGDVSKLAITGFCWGGNVVWTYSSHNPKVKAAVAWYGPLSSTRGPAPAKSPLELIPEIKTPVLGLYAGKDKGISLEDVEKAKTALTQAKSPSQIVVYPEVEHGFHADYRPSFNEAAAKDGWSKLLGWLKKHGV
jgi:carboxymethylenebutenolidase